MPAGPDNPIERAVTLRKQFIATAAALAATEEEAARVQDALAAAHSGDTAQYLRSAEEARARASELRDAARRFGG